MGCPFHSTHLRTLCCLNHNSSRSILTSHIHRSQRSVISACNQLQLCLRSQFQQKVRECSTRNISPPENKQPQCLNEFEFACRATNEACAKSNEILKTNFTSCLGILKFFLLTCFAAIAPSKHYVDVFFMTAKI